MERINSKELLDTLNEIAEYEMVDDDAYDDAFMKEYINKELDKCGKAIGPLLACQLSIKLFIADLSRNMENISYAINVYKWLGQVEYTIHELFQNSYDKSVFILEVLEKYQIDSSDSNILSNYNDAITSLKYQKSLIVSTN